MRALLSLVIVAVLTGCMSAEWHKSRIEGKASVCLTNNIPLADASKCLAANGIQIQRSEYLPELYFYYSCWPYWGYPLVSSCGSIQIRTNPDGVIDEWKIDGTIEELHG